MYSSSILIQELPSTGVGRQIFLAGAGLPHQGADWGFELRETTTWYPGNGREASQQILGPKELPSSWQGEWKRTLLPKSRCAIIDESGQVTQVIAPSQLRNAIEDIGRAGLLLRVIWMVQSIDQPDANDQIIREGRIKTAKFPHNRTQDIQWNIEFSWKSRGEAQQAPIETRDTALGNTITSIHAALDLLRAELEKQGVHGSFKQSNPSIRNSANPFTLGQLEQLADLPQKLAGQLQKDVFRITSQIQQIGDIALKVRSIPFAVANTAVLTAKDTIAICNQFSYAWGRVPPEKASLSSNVSDVTRAAEYFGRTNDAAQKAARASDGVIDQIRKAVTNQAALQGVLATRTTSTTANDILAVYVTRDGDTPVSISMRFYGDADHGADILRANRLPEYQTTFGNKKPIIIPKLARLAPRLNG